jgi:hypothetical protein
MEEMDTSKWMSVVYGLLLLLLLWPAFMRMPKHNWQRNLAIWLALFAAAGLVYELFGPF